MAEKKASATKKSAAAKSTSAKVDYATMTDDQINVLAAQNAVSLWDPKTGNARSRDELIAAMGEAQKTVAETS